MTVLKPTRHLVIYLTYALLAALMAALPAQASDVFTVANVHVDARGADAIDAQTQANQQGQFEAAQILFERLTLPRQRAGKNLGAISQADISRMIRGLTVANEKRSTSRYIGDVTVAFNPSQVQNFLKAQKLDMIASQAQTRLVIATEAGAPMSSDSLWIQTWKNPAFEYALTPVIAYVPARGEPAIGGMTSASEITASQARGLDMKALRQAGSRYGQRQILVASLSGIEGSYRVKMQDISLDSGETANLGTVSAPSMEAAARTVVSRLEDDWKSATVTLAENATSTQISVLYRSLGDWLDLQDVINGAAQIQDARLEALSKDGALMTLTYGGNFDRLKNELAYKGVELRRDGELGTVLYLRGRY